MSKNLLPNSSTDQDEIITPTEKRSVRVDFTVEQIYTLSLQLAKKTKDLAAAEEEKKSITSQYAAKVNELKANCNVLSNKVTDGYEMQEVECTVKYHFPAKNKKTYTRSDNGEAFTEVMEQSDHNLFNQESDVNEDDGYLGRHSYKNKKKH